MNMYMLIHIGIHFVIMTRRHKCHLSLSQACKSWPIDLFFFGGIFCIAVYFWILLMEEIRLTT